MTPERRIATTLAALLLVGSPAGAGEQAPPAPSKPKRDAQPAVAPGSDVLRGPSTDDKTVPGAAGSFGPSSDPNARERARAQAEAFNRALESLMAPTAPAAARLTPQQVETVTIARRELEAAEAKFRRDNADELRALRDIRRSKPGQPAPAGAAPPNAPDAMAPAPTPAPDRRTGAPGASGATGARAAQSPEERAAMMERLRALEDRRPSPAAYQAKVWGALTDVQQGALRAEMDKIADEMMARREAQKKAQPGKTPDGAGAKGAPASGPGERKGAPAPKSPGDAPPKKKAPDRKAGR